MNLYFSSVPPRVTAVNDTSNIVLWGDPFSVTFTISNAQPQVDPDNITWSFVSASSGNSTSLVEDATDRYSFSPDRQTLMISNVLLEDEGRYTMNAENPGGASQASVSVQVRGTIKEDSTDSIMVYE